MVRGGGERGEEKSICNISHIAARHKRSAHSLMDSSFIVVIDIRALVVPICSKIYYQPTRTSANMVATHQDVNASPLAPQAVEQGLEKKPLPAIVAGELEQVVAGLVRKALSNPATWPGGLPTTPACSFGPSTPPLDADELEKQLLGAAETRSQSTDIDDGPSPGINEPCKARFKRVLEMYVPEFAYSYEGLLTPE
jgi:hypothetical protein